MLDTVSKSTTAWWQAVLISRGLESVGISSAGERPLPPDQDQLDDFSPKTLDRFGRAQRYNERDRKQD